MVVVVSPAAAVVVVVSPAAAVVVVVSPAAAVVSGATVVSGGWFGTLSVDRPRASSSATWAACVPGPYQPSAVMPSSVWSRAASSLGPHS